MINVSLTIAFVLSLVVSPVFSDTAIENTDLARWKGGSLSREQFRRDYDPDEEILKAGGEALAKIVCKASYQEIYGAQARLAGIDREPGFLKDYENWRRKKLASFYVERNRPNLEPSEEELRDRYANRLEDYMSSGSADLKILFVRCAGKTLEACGQRMESYQKRLKAGERLEDLIAEEQKQSGEANGSFNTVPLSRLSQEIRSAVLGTSEGYTPVVSGPSGKFLVYVSGLKRPHPLAFELIRNGMAKTLRGEKDRAWRLLEVKKLREQLESPQRDPMTEQVLFAKAAERNLMHIEASFLEAEKQWRRWNLADAAFFRDREMIPSDEEIQETLRDPTTRLRYERRKILLMVVSAAKARDQLIPLANQLRQQLQESSETEAVMTEMIRKNPAVETFLVSAVSLGQWQRLHPLLSSEQYAAPVGRVTEPIAFRESFVISTEVTGAETDWKVPSGLGFSLVQEVKLMPIEELRERFSRKARDELTSIPSFLKKAGERWEYELLVDY